MPHWKKPDGKVEPSRFPYPNPEDNPEFSFIAAAGGIASSVNEMAEYLKAQIDAGKSGGGLISEDSFSRIQTLHIKRPEGYFGVHGYGYGLDVTPDFLGHRMLGHIVQEKSGMPFHRYVKEKVMNPLGMRRSTMNTDEFNADPDHIVPHWKKPNGRVEPSRFPYPNPEDNPEFSFIAAAGGIASSVNEMTEYLKAQIDAGRSRGGLLSEDSFKKIHTLHVRRPDGYYGLHGYGYGLDVTLDFLGHKMVGHGGSILVSTAYMAFIPDMGAGVVMMGNSAKLPYEEIAESVFATMMGREPSEAIPSIVIKNRMSELAGNYEIYRGIEKVRVVRRGGMLYLEQKDEFTDALVPLIPEDPTLESKMFYALTDGVKAPVEFVVRGGGLVDLFVERYCYHKRAN